MYYNLRGNGMHDSFRVDENESNTVSILRKLGFFIPTLNYGGQFPIMFFF